MAAATPKNRQAKAAAIQLPSVRTYRTWTPALLRQAESSADAGHIRLAVDVCDWLLGDGKVRGALDGRINGVFGLPLAFEGSGDGRRRKRAIKALEVGEDWDAIFPDEEAVQVNYWAILLGLGSGVNRWQRMSDHGDRDVPVLEFFHPQPLRYDWAVRTWMRRLDAGGEVPLEFGDGVWFGHMPFGSYRPWSMGLWRGIAPWVLLKSMAISDFGRLGEAASTVVIEVDKDTKDPKDKRKELASLISEKAADAGLVLPPGYHYKLVEASAATKDIYSQQLNLADTAIAITIRGGNLTTNVESGSRAAAEVQERVGDEGNRRRDARAWESTTRKHTLVPWSTSNYGDARLAPFPVYDTDTDDNRRADAEIFVKAIEGVEKAEGIGFEVDRPAFSDRFGFNDFLKPGEVKAPPKPAEPGPEDDDDDDDEPEPDTDDEGAETADANAKRLGDRIVRPQAAAKADNGQRYTDDIVEEMTAHGAKELTATVAAMVSAVRNAGSYDEAKNAIRAKYEGLASPARLASLTEAAITMCQMSGHLAVREDIPELDEEE
jgi:hypothetical protein